MKKPCNAGKKATLAVAVILLIVLCGFAAFPVDAKSGGDIHIDKQGNITPAGSPIQRSGNVFVLTSDLSETGITVESSNIVFDGNNHTITISSLLKGALALNNVDNVTVKNLNVNGGAFGIVIAGNQNQMVNNRITGTQNGIYGLDEPTEAIGIAGSGNNITGNNLYGNNVGLNFMGDLPNQCINNTITQNTVANSNTALLFYDCSNNRIYYNNFLDNQITIKDTGYIAYDKPSQNVWDDGQHLGNFWNNYKTVYPNATDRNGSGVGDTAYFVKPPDYVDPSSMPRAEATQYWQTINAKYAVNVDHYPLMAPFTTQLYAQVTTQPTLNLTSPTQQTYDTTNITLAVTADKPLSWIGYSLDGASNKTIPGEATLCNLTEGTHNIRVYARDLYGNTATQSANFTINTPKQTTQPLPLVAIVVLVAITITVGLVIVQFTKKKE